MRKIITSLELGSEMMRGCVSAVSLRQPPEVLALDNIPSNGIAAGAITDFEAARNDVCDLIGRLEKMINGSIRRVSVSISGKGIGVTEAHGMIALSKKPRQIWTRDVRRCEKVAGMVMLPEDRLIMHECVRCYSINEGEVVRDPVGLYATKLAASVYLVTADLSLVKNMRKCVEQTGYLLEDIVVSPVALSESILVNGSAGKTTAIIDIGGDST
ncbi:MAG: hypothetical protein ABH885_06040, partial [Candidatus Omnitrophota bacterium]